MPPVISSFSFGVTERPKEATGRTLRFRHRRARPRFRRRWQQPMGQIRRSSFSWPAARFPRVRGRQLRRSSLAFYPGQQQGNSIADVLFGDVKSERQVAVTFPQSASQLPNFTLSGNLLQYPRCDTAHGYFRMDKMGVKPLFWFGHGLSYTTFSYANLAGLSIADQGRGHCSGPGHGDECRERCGKRGRPALFVNAGSASLPARVQDLRGFKKVSLNAGIPARLTLWLTQEEMRVYNPNGTDFNGTGIWTVLPGHTAYA